MTGQPVEETSMASTVSRKRRKALTKLHWAKMQPYIKEYYIKQDLTLEETMRRISAEHEFEATYVEFPQEASLIGAGGSQ
jgi:sulfur relay (sulfurtransferase) DsrC/TusE family protein